MGISEEEPKVAECDCKAEETGVSAAEPKTEKTHTIESDKAKDDEDEENPDPYYPPIIHLPEVVVNDGEDDEVEIFKKRARLYRYAHECQPAEWKERGTGDVKILKTKDESSARIVMRREQTLKLCANHLIVPWMELKPNCNNKKSWVWKTVADFADDPEGEESKQETLAIRFGTEESAQAFEKAFIVARQMVLEKQAEAARKEQEAEPLILDGKSCPDGDENKEAVKPKEEINSIKEESGDNNENEELSKEELEQKMTGLRV